MIAVVVAPGTHSISTPCSRTASRASPASPSRATSGSSTSCQDLESAVQKFALREAGITPDTFDRTAARVMIDVIVTQILPFRI